MLASSELRLVTLFVQIMSVLWVPNTHELITTARESTMVSWDVAGSSKTHAT